LFLLNICANVLQLKVNRNIVPGFYRFLQEQTQAKQIEYAEEFKEHVGQTRFLQTVTCCIAGEISCR
jgi:hypothetical protein